MGTIKLQQALHFILIANMTRRAKMKSTFLIALLCSVCVMNVNAREQVALNEGVKASGFSGERITVAESDVNNALRLKFISRRGYQNPAVKNKDDYKADDAWVGATHVDERESKASKRLNRQFRSKRPHIDYQFD
jgi:hypothetical protein